MKKLYHHDKPISGIDISSTGIKLMAIDTKKWSVLGYSSIDLDPVKLQDSINTGDEYLAQALQQLVGVKLNGKLPSNQAVLSVPTSRTYSRAMSLPLNTDMDLAAAVQLEAEQYIPLPTSELNIDYSIIEKTDTDMTIIISAVPKKIVESIMSACESAHIEPVLVEPGISSVARLLGHVEEGHLPTVIVDIGAATTDIAVLDDFIRVTGGVNVGGNSFTINISKKLKTSLEAAHQLKILSGLNAGTKQEKIVEALQLDLDKIAREVQKIIRYYSERIGGNKKIEQVVIVGAGSNMPGLGEYFTDSLVMPARVASPWQILDFGKLPQPSKHFKPRYITAAGLACVKPKEIWG